MKIMLRNITPWKSPLMAPPKKTVKKNELGFEWLRMSESNEWGKKHNNAHYNVLHSCKPSRFTTKNAYVSSSGRLLLQNHIQATASRKWGSYGWPKVDWAPCISFWGCHFKWKHVDNVAFATQVWSLMNEAATSGSAQLMLSGRFIHLNAR